MTTLPPDHNGSQPEQPEQPEQPATPATPPQADSPAQPETPSAPQQPAAPQYQAPPAGGYQAPPAGGYQQPGYAPAPATNPVGNLQLNYWLSVFFTWIPALIFFLVDKDKGDARLRQLHAANLNFTLLRIFAIIAAWILAVILVFIPYIGGLLSVLLYLVATIGGFVLHIMGAVKVQQAYQTGQPVDPFVFNLPMVK